MIIIQKKIVLCLLIKHRKQWYFPADIKSNYIYWVSMVIHISYIISWFNSEIQLVTNTNALNFVNEIVTNQKLCIKHNNCCICKWGCDQSEPLCQSFAKLTMQLHFWNAFTCSYNYQLLIYFKHCLQIHRKKDL